MAILQKAFSNLLNAKERVVGEREKVTVDGVDKDALVEIISVEEVLLAGGVGEAGGFKCQIAVSEFEERPEDGTSIQVRDKELSVLQVDDINGVVYLITAGDPVV